MSENVLSDQDRCVLGCHQYSDILKNGRLMVSNVDVTV